MTDSFAHGIVKIKSKKYAAFRMHCRFINHNFVLSPQNIKYESNRVKIKSLLIWGLK